MLSFQIDESIWNALDDMCEDGVGTKRSHLERALLRYIDISYFENEADWKRLFEKYRIET
jgi:hypothetical protein